LYQQQSIMAKQKKINKMSFFEAFTSQTLTEEKMPKSVYLFCQKAALDEAEFYAYFGSLDALRTAIFESFFDNAIGLLDQANREEEETPKDQLLRFYFTFFEVLQHNRSYVLFALNEGQWSKKWTDLKGLRSRFKSFAITLIEAGNAQKTGPFSQRSVPVFAEAAWGQMLFLLRFWMKDTSGDSEKTDIAIEKSVQTVFSLFDNQALDQVFDFGKFLWREKNLFSR